MVADYFSRNFRDISTIGANKKNYSIYTLGRECVHSLANSDGSRLIAKLPMRTELWSDLEELAGLQAIDEMTKCLQEKG